MPTHIISKPEATFARLAAILDAGYKLGADLERPVSIGESSTYFTQNYQNAFWRKKADEDQKAQQAEIDIYKFGESQRLGYDIGHDRAVAEWTEKYAEIFRRHRESPRRNGFFFIEKHIVNNYGLHMRPSHEISEVVRKYYCNVFVNHEKVQDLISRDFILSLLPEEQAFVQDLMPESDVLNLSALSAITKARSGMPDLDQLQKDRELNLMATITLKYRVFYKGLIPERQTEMEDFDLFIEDEFNEILPYMDLTTRKFKRRAGVVPDLLSLAAIPGDILRFVLYGQDKDKAAADILYVLSKHYDGRSKQKKPKDPSEGS